MLKQKEAEYPIEQLSFKAFYSDSKIEKAKRSFWMVEVKEQISNVLTKTKSKVGAGYKWQQKLEEHTR